MLRMLNSRKNRLKNSRSVGELGNLNTDTAYSKLRNGTAASRRSSREVPKKPSESQALENNTGKVMSDVPGESVGSRYPKRKRASVFNTPTESKLENVDANVTEILSTSPVSINNSKSNAQDLGSPGDNGVVLGVWRHSSIPDNQRKHAVIGFIDVNGRLRTGIQPTTKYGEPIAEGCPVPTGTGDSWVPFDRIIFSDHLVGLHYFQVKEYTRLRSQAASEESEGGRSAADHAAVQEAVRRVKEQLASGSYGQSPVIAYGVDLPGNYQVPIRSNLKPTAVNGHLAAVNPDHPAGSAPQYDLTAHQSSLSTDPLSGTRPTHVLIGCWKLLNEVDPKDSNAAYGILDQNNIFHVQVMLQTKKGRCMNGSYSIGAGAWHIPYEEVELEPHLRALNRLEVKEYCRVRQYQLDHEETSAERIENETKAVYEAQIRAGMALYTQPRDVTGCMSTASLQDEGDESFDRHICGVDDQSCQSHGLQQRSMQAVLGGGEQQLLNQPQDAKSTEVARPLAHQEAAGAKDATCQAIDHAICRERALAAAAAAAATSLKHHLKTNSVMPHCIPDNMQRLNGISARQETLGTKSSSVIKVCGGHEYERKTAGPFAGKLISQGTLINIDGDEYVEYRVLTKPSFF